DPVDVDVALVSGVSAFWSGDESVASGADVSAGDSGDDSDDGPVDGVSAHATPHPYPVTTAAPTPRATAKPPTRPTYMADRMALRIRQRPRARGFLRKRAHPRRDAGTSDVQSALQPNSNHRSASSPA